MLKWFKSPLTGAEALMQSAIIEATTPAVSGEGDPAALVRVLELLRQGGTAGTEHSDFCVCHIKKRVKSRKPGVQHLSLVVLDRLLELGDPRFRACVATNILKRIEFIATSCTNEVVASTALTLLKKWDDQYGNDARLREFAHANTRVQQLSIPTARPPAGVAAQAPGNPTERPPASGQAQGAVGESQTGWIERPRPLNAGAREASAQAVGAEAQEQDLGEVLRALGDRGGAERAAPASKGEGDDAWRSMTYSQVPALQSFQGRGPCNSVTRKACLKKLGGCHQFTCQPCAG